MKKHKKDIKIYEWGEIHSRVKPEHFLNSPYKIGAKNEI